MDLKYFVESQRHTAVDQGRCVDMAVVSIQRSSPISKTQYLSIKQNIKNFNNHKHLRLVIGIQGVIQKYAEKCSISFVN